LLLNHFLLPHSVAVLVDLKTVVFLTMHSFFIELLYQFIAFRDYL
jgi:hypothetical protein